jgi:tripeptide aminopeptidase
MMINAQRITEEFAHLASIASPSGREGEIAHYLVERFSRLGAAVIVDDAAERAGSQSGNIIARLAGTREGEPVLLSAHMDTVEPAEGVKPLLIDGVFTSAGETILGADDKAGIAEIIEALEVLREEGIKHPPIEVVITVCEETGLSGAKALDPELLTARRGFALDTSGVDLLIHKAPSANKLRIEIIGRESHAGISPEKGLSAIAIASHAIATMRLGRIDEETTANIGTVQGGQAVNIVPRKVVIEGEARSHNASKLSVQTAHMIDCFREAARLNSKEIDGRVVEAEVRVEILSDYPLMAVSRNAPVVALAETAASHLGRRLEVRAAGGGSDANIFNSHGIETVILGTGMTAVHSVEESVRVDDMVSVAELLVEILRVA